SAWSSPRSTEKANPQSGSSPAPGSCLQVGRIAEPSCRASLASTGSQPTDALVDVRLVDEAAREPRAPEQAAPHEVDDHLRPGPANALSIADPLLPVLALRR